MSILNANPSDPGANAYVLETEASTYLDQYRLYSSEWDAASEADHEKAIIWATMLIDRGFDFRGSQTSFFQALRWPRIGIYDDDMRYVDQFNVPPVVKQSCIILAAELIKQDRTNVPDLISLGFRSAKVGPLSVDVDATRILPFIPDFVIAWLGQYGEVRPSMVGSSGKVVKLQRS